MRHSTGRNYKVPFAKETVKKRVAFDKLPEDSIGLLPTPGLPLLTQDTTEVLMGTNFGNFRRQTLLRYLDSLEDSAELKAKILDWKPEVLETKTRRQSNQVKTSTNYKEIFGIDLPVSPPVSGTKDTPKKKKGSSATPTVESVKRKLDEEQPPETPTKSSSKKDGGKGKKDKDKQEKGEKTKKSKGKKSKAGSVEEEDKSVEDATPLPPPLPPAEVEEADESEYVPTEKEEELQAYLQDFALSLLDDNLSWSNRRVIQNLVIWEPVEPPPGTTPVTLSKYKKKGKKYKKRQSGLDFSSSKKKSSKGKGETSRAASVERDNDASAEIRSIRYSLDSVINESKDLVVDKGAGESILHRAAKMDYPDVAAYALDILGLSPRVKDNAGIPPIHKAAFKGNHMVVEILLK
jgi:hypothetical protein